MLTVRTRVLALLTLVLAVVMAAAGTTARSSPPGATTPSTRISTFARGDHHHSVLGYRHVVVIFQENHSFDNLFGGWGRVAGRSVAGLPQAKPGHTVQLAQDGTAFSCLPQNDVNLAALPATCTDAAHGVKSAFTNAPFTIDDYIQPNDTTCPEPGASGVGNGVLNGHGLPGGCTRDLVHRFYQEKYQINGGRQNRYVTGSNAVGLTMGVYDTKQLPIYRYLHRRGAPKYVIADHFFQGAHGGSFLNHQWLISGRAPLIDPHGQIPSDTTVPKNSVVDANGMPIRYPQYVPTSPVVDGPLTVQCADPAENAYSRACGDFAVNTIQPASPPYEAHDPAMPLIDDRQYPNIGDRMTAKGVSWAWYAGGWADAAAGHPGPLFQTHHQPFNYYAEYAPGKPGRDHLKDETEFFQAAKRGALPTVSFVKPYGAENEHPGYASDTNGNRHVVDLVTAIQAGPQARNTLVIITYDEFGGSWDHVSPPGPGSRTPGAYDAFGPGTRIPALLLSARMRHSGVDHRSYDTTSILATLERSLHLQPVGIRDTRVADLRHAVRISRGW
jgi:phospholipase C